MGDTWVLTRKRPNTFQGEFQESTYRGELPCRAQHAVNEPPARLPLCRVNHVVLMSCKERFTLRRCGLL
jgi:hypothetical protein